MNFENDLQNLKRLFLDSEQELKKFDEIVPYEHNPNNIYSPKLVNLLLQIGPQIEGVTDLIASKKTLKVQSGGVPSRIEKINHKGVLSRFEITSLLNGALFTPFPQKASWWDTYNNTKHNLSQSQFDITYQSVMNALAALAALHRLADAIKGSAEEHLELILDKQYWQSTFSYLVDNEETTTLGIPNSWKSEIFRISNYFIYAPYR
ncbi:MAG: hypothetical protein IIC67_07210 [Thaumarchaeota archaeon]|nr:hypothetical protein [Nitrososphaerota archaeon]